MPTRTLLVQAAHYTIAGREKEKRNADAFFTLKVPAHVPMYHAEETVKYTLQLTIDQMLPKNSADRYEVMSFKDYPEFEKLDSFVFLANFQNA